MDKTYLDEMVEYPAKVIQRICESKEFVALIANKKVAQVTEDDIDDIMANNIFDYQYVDDTVSETCAYVMVEADCSNVSNKQIKEMKIYVTVACHKNFMKLDTKLFPKFSGNRRDNLVRYVDKELNDQSFFGIGTLKLDYAKSMTSSNQSFTMRTLCYEVSDFNIKAIQ